jgi:hypothetical protein
LAQVTLGLPGQLALSGISNVPGKPWRKMPPLWCPMAFFAAKVSQTIPFSKDSANYIRRAKLCKHFFAFSCRLMPESP